MPLRAELGGGLKGDDAAGAEAAEMVRPVRLAGENGFDMARGYAADVWRAAQGGDVGLGEG